MTRLITVALLTSIIVCAGAGVLGSGAEAAGSAQVTRILVAPDTSGSLDPKEYHAALAGVAAAIVPICETGSVRELAILPWATPAQCWRSPEWRIALPVRRELPPARIAWSEAGQLFRLYRDQKLRETQAGRQQEQAHLDAAFRRELAASLTRFQAALAKAQQGKAACTGVTEILKRCSQEGSSTLAILITDGKEECSRSHLAPLPRGARTVIVLVPCQTDEDGASLDERRTFLESLAPWALIVPSFRLTDKSIDWVTVLVGGNKAPGDKEQAAVLSSGGILR